MAGSKVQIPERPQHSGKTSPAINSSVHRVSKGRNRASASEKTESATGQGSASAAHQPEQLTARATGQGSASAAHQPVQLTARARSLEKCRLQL